MFLLTFKNLLTIIYIRYKGKYKLFSIFDWVFRLSILRNMSMLEFLQLYSNSELSYDMYKTFLFVTIIYVLYESIIFIPLLYNSFYLLNMFYSLLFSSFLYLCILSHSKVVLVRVSSVQLFVDQATCRPIEQTLI